MKARSRHIQSIERAMALLELLKAYPQGARLTDLCVPNGLTKSTAHGLLDTLADMGYVTHQGSRYLLGSRIQTLAHAGHDRNERLRQLFTPALQAFNESCEANCFLAIPSGARTYLTLDALDAGGHPLTQQDDDQRDALRTSAVGKVFLAHDPMLARRVRRSAPLGKDLEHELLRINECGYALDIQASEPGLNCMAIPLRVKGKVVGALGTSGPADRLAPQVMQLMAKRAMRDLFELVKY
ncbi:IclR family transcriptional regulator [Pseudomonas sp. NPDC089734]|uniref:IclR family transcriptional regulator n=1 Tax=Pseudomonas sp. NPDC089734 TaxID=3364469 RepID=UPI00380D4B87